jgi:glucosamine-phosphate N-acetyltransferase
MEITKTNKYHFNEHWIDSFNETLSALAECKLHIRDLQDIILQRDARGVNTLVAVENDEIIGTVSYFIEPKFIHNGGYVGHLEDLATHPDHGGKGIGKKLVEEVIRSCEEAGCYKIILDCDENLEVYYNKLGFHKHGIYMRYDI